MLLELGETLNPYVLSTSLLSLKLNLKIYFNPNYVIMRDIKIHIKTQQRENPPRMTKYTVKRKGSEAKMKRNKHNKKQKNKKIEINKRPKIALLRE